MVVRLNKDTIRRIVNRKKWFSIWLKAEHFLIESENLKLERWAEYFNQVLSRPEPTETANVDENFFWDIELESPTKEEIKKAINKLRNNKAPGIDSLESELFKADTR